MQRRQTVCDIPDCRRQRLFLVFSTEELQPEKHVGAFKWMTSKSKHDK
jgi:hypothetical protein